MDQTVKAHEIILADNAVPMGGPDYAAVPFGGTGGASPVWAATKVEHAVF
jgi:hypothetical protein